MGCAEHRDFDLRVRADVEEAIRSEHLLTLRHLIENRFGVHNKRNTMCLYQAIGRGSLEMVKMLLDAGVDRDYYAATAGVGAEVSPLHRALDLESPSVRWRMVRLLMESGVSPKREDLYRQSSVFRAVEQGDREMVRVLFVCGAKMNCEQFNSSRGFSPLHAAVKWLDGEQCIKMVRLLIEVGADVKAADRGFRKTCLHLVPHMESGYCQVLRLLLDAGANLNCQAANGSTPLSIATSLGKVDLMRQIIASGADVNLPKQFVASPLYFAIFNHNRDALRLLLENGADTNARRDYSSNIVSWAADFGVDRNKAADYIDILKILLAHDAENLRNRTEKNILFQSVLKLGNLNAVKLFLECGVNLENCGVLCPLHHAAKNETKDILKYLLEHYQFDIDKIYDEDNQICTALYKAVCAHRRDNVRLLIEWGADVNIPRVIDRVGEGRDDPVPLITSPLYSAVIHRDRKIVDLLLSAGATLDANVNSEKWQRILDIILYESITYSLVGEVILLKDQNHSDPFNRNFLVETFADLMPELEEWSSAELEVLKSLTFYGSVTLYDLLRGKDVTRYIKNSQVIDSFKSQAVGEFFLMYGNRIENCYALAKVKREIMDEAMKKLDRLLRYRFSHCIEILYTIIIHLPLKDLRNICKV